MGAMDDYLEYYYYDYNIRRRRLLICIAICVCMLWYKLQEHRFMRRPKYGSLLERDLERLKPTVLVSCACVKFFFTGYVVI
jgi:hypothetical protein